MNQKTAYLYGIGAALLAGCYAAYESAFFIWLTATPLSVTQLKQAQTHAYWWIGALCLTLVVLVVLGIRLRFAKPTSEVRQFVPVALGKAPDLRARPESAGLKWKDTPGWLRVITIVVMTNAAKAGQNSRAHSPSACKSRPSFHSNYLKSNPVSVASLSMTMRYPICR